jgi:hypothetical protein
LAAWRTALSQEELFGLVHLVPGDGQVIVAKAVVLFFLGDPRGGSLSGCVRYVNDRVLIRLMETK